MDIIGRLPVDGLTIVAIPVFVLAVVLEAAGTVWAGRRTYDVPDALTSIAILGFAVVVAAARRLAGVAGMTVSRARCVMWWTASGGRGSCCSFWMI